MKYKKEFKIVKGENDETYELNSSLTSKSLEDEVRDDIFVQHNRMEAIRDAYFNAYRVNPAQIMDEYKDFGNMKKYIANDKEKEWYNLFAKGQIDLLEFMKQAPETMKRYLESGDYHIDKVLEGIEKKAATIKAIDDMFLSPSEETKLQEREIEQATQGVRMSEIDAETQAIRTEITHEKDNSIEERE